MRRWIRRRASTVLVLKNDPRRVVLIFVLSKEIFWNSIKEDNSKKIKAFV